MSALTRKILYFFLGLVMMIDFYLIFNAGNPNSFLRLLVKDTAYDISITVALSIVIVVISMSMIRDNDQNSIQNAIQNSVYIDPVLISDLTAQDTKLDKILKNPEIICIEDNGIGFNSESWKDLLRVFNIRNNPDILYTKSLNSENKHFKDLFSIFAEPIGIGFPIIQKICRIGGISAIVESIPVDDMKNSIHHGTKFYLIFPLTS